MMTGMEQSLRYIEREIRFMVKDQFGNMTYAKYADRVIEDTCGIPNFCSTVLSSKRPLSVILRAVRGPRGDIIMKFFNVALHDARVEMVMVLAEASKLRIHRNKTSRDAHEYLLKLYRKAIKRTTRLITGSKNKESYKSLYRGLRDFAHMNDFDYDDEYDDEDFFEDTDFGDSEFAEESLEAIRNGENPPEMKPRTNTLIETDKYRYDIGLGGNEEILKDIAAIEFKLGRHLSDAELDELLCGDDEDIDTSDTESLYPKIPINLLKKNSDDMMDSIVDEIYNRLLKKMSGTDTDTPVSPTVTYGMMTSKPESLDEFLSKHQEAKSTTNDVNSDKSVVSEIQSDTSLEALVGMHNQLKNQSSESEDAEDSNELPPNGSLGGNEDDDGNKNGDEEIMSSGNLVATTNVEVDPKEEHYMILKDIIRDIENVEILRERLSEKLINYITAIGLDLTDIFITIRPSKEEEQLIELVVHMRVTGDYSVIDIPRLNMIVSEHAKVVADTMGLLESVIGIDFDIVDSKEIFSEEMSEFSVIAGANRFLPLTNHLLTMALCAMLKYIYSRTNKMLDIRFINSPIQNNILLYFFNKDGSDINEELSLLIIEMVEEDIIHTIMNEFEVSERISADFELYVSTQPEVLGEFYDELIKALETPNIKAKINTYLESNEQYISNRLNDLETPGEIESNSILSYQNVSVVVDNTYRILTSKEISVDDKTDIVKNLKVNGEYRSQLRDILSIISSNTDVNSYLSFSVNEPDEVVEEDTISPTPATSNFGI